MSLSAMLPNERRALRLALEAQIADETDDRLAKAREGLAALNEGLACDALRPNARTCGLSADAPVHTSGLGHDFVAPPDY